MILIFVFFKPIVSALLGYSAFRDLKIKYFQLWLRFAVTSKLKSPFCPPRLMSFLVSELSPSPYVQYCRRSQIRRGQRRSMSLACLVCHGVESPSRSLRSYSVSSSDNDGRCSAMASCLSKMPPHRGNPAILPSSKVTPQPPATNNGEGFPGTPRLVRSHAVRRDLVRDWNFDDFDIES